MDIGEWIYKTVLFGLKRVRGTPARPSSEAVFLRTTENRTRILAALLAGEALEIKPSDGVGGWAGTALLMPNVIDVLDKAGNETLWTYRVAYSVASRALGFTQPEGLGDPRVAYLPTLLAVRPTERRMENDYPGATALRNWLYPKVLQTRSPHTRSASASTVLETLCRIRLGASATRDDVADHAEAWRWLTRAAAIDVHTQTELDAISIDLAQELLQIVPGSGHIQPAAVIAWGELHPPARPEPAPASAVDSVPSESSKRHAIDVDATMELRSDRPQKPREDRPIYHMFEKVETAEEYGGQNTTPDSTSSGDDLEDAIRDLKLGAVIRTMEEPEHMVRADVLANAMASVTVAERVEDAQQVYRYPEWDFRKRRYRQDWCTVTEYRVPAGPKHDDSAGWAATVLNRQRRQVEEIRAQLERTLFRRTVKNRQLDGPEIDVEAMVERHADLKAGRTPPERLFLSDRKTPKDVAIVILLDTSFSTDAWVDGKRVLETEVESVLVLAEAFKDYLEEQVTVASFSSRTRVDCRFAVLKGFEHPWTHLKRTAPNLKPEGYTRIGPALRHATFLLGSVLARKKLLLVVTDGKPTDYDQYEGKYGVEDVANAVREAHQRGVLTYALAVEKQAKFHYSRMLGPGRYQILPKTSVLADIMADVFVRLVAR